jgi:hypothetical protein
MVGSTNGNLLEIEIETNTTQELRIGADDLELMEIRLSIG